jgi:hypothetical protein
MPIKKDTLDAIARAYVVTMTSIRGWRVHRLLMREFSRFDHVLLAVAEDGTPAFLALAEGGSAAVCRTDGRGAAVAIAEWARLEGATVTMSYDLARDSLLIVSWTIWHPSFAHVAGPLTISATGHPHTESQPYHRHPPKVRRVGAVFV